MAIVMRMHAPGSTVEQYEGINRRVGVTSDADAPDGLIQHVAGMTDDGMVVIDVWESEEKLNAFFEERVGAALAAEGVNAGPPEILKLHNMIRRGSGTQANVIVELRVDAGPDVYDELIAAMPTHAGDGSGHPVYSHVAAVTKDGGTYVMDLWESPEEFGRFVEQELAPVAGDRLGEVQPSFTPVKGLIHGRAPVTA